VTAALFPERYACPTCHGQDTIPAHPDTPGDGWVIPCPFCHPGSAPQPHYDPEHAEIPY
jgi:hypothetical protein